jgi:GNAT superfamily N-acetyltransferase
MTAVPQTTVRLTSRDERAAVATLAAAFVDYPLMHALCPNAKRRPQATRAYCRFIFRMTVRCGGAYATLDRSAVICSLPPGNEWPSGWTILRPGGFSLLWQLGFRGTGMFALLESETDAAREEHVPGPHHYIAILCVRPEAQGKGLARAVLRAVFDAADKDRVPVYLETIPEVNVTIYKKIGFELLGHRELTGGLSNWEMRRPVPPAEPSL